MALARLRRSAAPFTTISSTWSHRRRWSLVGDVSNGLELDYAEPRRALIIAVMDSAEPCLCSSARVAAVLRRSVAKFVKVIEETSPSQFMVWLG